MGGACLGGGGRCKYYLRVGGWGRACLGSRGREDATQKKRRLVKSEKMRDFPSSSLFLYTTLDGGNISFSF